MSAPVATPAARQYLRWALVEGVGPTLLKRMLEALGGIDATLGAPAHRLAAVRGIGARTADRIARMRDVVDVGAELRAAAELGVRIVCPEDPDFPPGLRRINDPPIVLYVRGRIEPRDAIALAVVGARRCSMYGQQQARRFGELLAGSGFTVVSGLARGIDAFAHHGALDAGGRTIAVLGCGLGQVYPPENRALAERIIASDAGCWISELPLASAPRAKNFPARNRIIAGLALGTLIVEASARSGALITARLAIEYNRELFAIPGRVQDPMSIGTNRLISEGTARLVTCLEDILEELRPMADALLDEVRATQPRRAAGPHASTPAEATASVPAELPAPEALVLAAVTDEPRYTDVIAQKSGLSIAEVLAAVTSLELRGLVRRLPGQQVVRTGRDTRRAAR